MNQHFYEETRATFDKVLKITAIIVLIIFLIFILLSMFRIGIIYWFYYRVFEWLTVRLGFDYYLAYFSSISLTAILSALCPYLYWTFFTGKYKLQTTVTIIGVSGIMCLLVYTIGNNVIFNRSTGQPMKWYADTPNGRFISNAPGYDPQFGIKLMPLTAEILLHEAEEEHKAEEISRRESEKKAQSDEEKARKEDEKRSDDRLSELDKSTQEPRHETKSQHDPPEVDPRLEAAQKEGEHLQLAINMYHQGRYAEAETIFRIYPNNNNSIEYLERIRVMKQRQFNYQNY